MVMGHTIQEAGVNAACGGAAVRVDVGLSAGCGDGRVQVLEILDDGAAIRVLREGQAPVTLPGDRGGAARRVPRWWPGGERERADAPPAQQPVPAVA